MPQTVEERSHPLKFLTSVWDNKRTLAQKAKDSEFGKWADECMAFYTGDRKSWTKYMSGAQGVISGEAVEPEDDVPQQFRFVMAKSAEFVQIYGPTLYHRNPVRTVTPRKMPVIPQQVIVDQANLRWIQKFDQQLQQAQQQAQQSGQPPQPPDPMSMFQYQQRQQLYQQQLARYDAIVQRQAVVEFKSQARASLVESYLAFTPNELDLKCHSRKAIDQALITGIGFLITEVKRHHLGGRQLVGSFYLDANKVLYDVDAEDLDEPRWIMIERKRPAWELAEEWGADEDELKRVAGKKTQEQIAKDKASREAGKGGKSNDLVTYYEVYSKMGMGDLLEGVDDIYRGALSEFGQYVYLVIVPGMPYPLNLPSELLELAIEGDEAAFEQAFEAVQWPIPFWLDGRWPIVPLFFHWIPGELWPMAHMRTSLPWLKFMNFAISFAANSAQHTSRLFVGLGQGEEEENKDAIKSGKAVTILQLKDPDVRKAITFLSSPNGVTVDLQNVAKAAEDEYEKSSGLAEAMYAQQGGIRSATEANMKQQAMNIRPDDMANKVEDWMSAVARNEALALLWLMTGEDIAPVLGDGAAEVWDELFADVDPGTIAMEFDYRIEAGSARKPNKASQQEQAGQALQTVVPAAMQVGDLNTANQMLELWRKANDFPDQIVLTPPPPQPDPAAQAKLQAEQAKAQALQQKTQADIQAKQLDAQIKQQESAADLQMKQAEHQMDLAFKQAEHGMEREKHQLELFADQARHSQEMRQDQQVHQQELEQSQQQGTAKLALDRMLGEAKVQQTRQMAAAKPKPTQGA